MSDFNFEKAKTLEKKELMIGDTILFHYDESFFSRAISKITKCKYAHVAGVYEIKENRVCLGEASGQGYVFNWYNIDGIFNDRIFDEKRFLILRPKKKINKAKFKEMMLNKIGKPYGWIDIFSIAIYYFSFKLIKLNTEMIDKDICSEAQAECIKYSNKKIDLMQEFKLNASQIRPDHFLDSDFFNIIF